METPAFILNEQFMEKMSNPEDMAKFASYVSDMIKDRLREEGFWNQVLTCKPVGRADLIPSVNHEGLVKMVQMPEMSQHASTMSFRNTPEVVYITAPRFLVPFYRTGSPRYEKTKIELMSYDVPITDTVMKNIPNDLSEIDDRYGITLSETACESGQKYANSIALTSVFSDTTACTAYNVAQGTCVEVSKCKSIDVVNNTAAANAAAGLIESLIFPVQKDDVIKLGKLFSGRGQKGSRMRVEKALWSDTDIADINSWTLTDVGDKIVGETTVEGYKYQKIAGMRHFRTLKTDILRPGNIYAFCSEEYLGGWMMLNKIEYYSTKVRDKFSFEAWKDQGMYLGNTYGVRKLELYAGSSEVATTTSAGITAYIANYSPFAEKDLGQLNNLIVEGAVVPGVVNF